MIKHPKLRVNTLILRKSASTCNNLRRKYFFHSEKILYSIKRYFDGKNLHFHQLLAVKSFQHDVIYWVEFSISFGLPKNHRRDISFLLRMIQINQKQKVVYGAFRTSFLLKILTFIYKQYFNLEAFCI